MKVIKKIINNVSVTIIKTKKFKSIAGKLYFKSPVQKEKLTYRAVLRSILLESCKKYNTSEKLYINSLENYNAHYSATSSRVGNYIINSFTFSSLVDKYTTLGNLNNVVDTFCEIVFNPLVENNGFDKETFDLIKSSYKSDLEKIKEDSKAYAERMAYKHLNQEKSYTYMSEIKYLDMLTKEKLYSEYLDMINNSEVELIVVGNISEKDEIIEKITNKIVNNKKFENNLIINNDEEKEEFKKMKEKGYGTQNILHVIMNIKNVSNYELNYVAPIYRIILGGSSSSRLFSNIREKESLAYYVFARLEKDDSLMEIIMGTSKEKYDKVHCLTMKIIDQMHHITNEELEDAKKIIITSLLESQDNILNVVGRYHNAKLFDLPCIDEFVKQINKVTKKEVEDFSYKINPILSYFLEGSETNE